MNLPINKNSLGVRGEFNALMDLFLGAWASFEMTTDFAIGKFLKTTHEQTHLITAGVTFGRRARLLADLVGHSDHPRKAEILGAFNKLCGMSTRDILIQCCRGSSEEVHFLERSPNGRFKTKSHQFAKLMAQLRDFAVASAEFYIALGMTDADIQSFAAAAACVSGKSQTAASPLSAAE